MTARADYDLIETMRFDPEGGLADLDRHLLRLGTSAEVLGFEFDRHDARNELQAATFKNSELAKVRLLLSPSGSMAIEITPIERIEGALKVAVRDLPVRPDDERLRHKTTARRFYDEARAEAGTDEVIFVDEAGRLTEGSWTSIFAKVGGELLTPPLERGILPGILRAQLIEQGEAREADIGIADLADGFQLGNSVRGLMNARLA